jgi:hypothetical protein
MLLLLLATSFATAEEEFNFLKQGYGWVLPDTVGGYGGAVGLLEDEQTQNPPIDFDFDNYEISWAYLDMEITEITEGLVKIWEMTGGTIAIYEDDTPDLDYGVHPNDGIATATDGIAALTGEIEWATFRYIVGDSTGIFTGQFRFTGGARIAELGNLVNYDWDIFHGTSAKAQVNVPPSYHSRFAGRVYVMGEVATKESSWSQIRSLY